MSSSVPPPGASWGGPTPPRFQGADPREERSDDPPWRLWTAPAAVGLGLALGALSSVIVAIVGTAGGSRLSHPTPAVNLIGNVLFDLAFVAAALYFVRLQGRPRASDFGFRRLSFRLACGAFVVGGLSYYVVTYAYSTIFGLGGSERLPQSLGVGKSTAAAVGVTVFVCVIAPICEEFFFRGFFFGTLRRWRIVVVGRNIGIWVAAVLTALLFGLAHAGSASPKYLIPLALLGFVLCLVRWRTRSLYPCMALHSFNNCLAVSVNQFHWNVGEIVALMVGSLLVIGALTGPLSLRAVSVPS